MPQRSSRVLSASSSSPAAKPVQLVTIDAGFDEATKKMLRLEVQEAFAEQILSLQAERDRLAAARMVDDRREAAELRIYQERKRSLGKAMTEWYAERVQDVRRSQSMETRTQAAGYKVGARPWLAEEVYDLKSAPGMPARGNGQIPLSDASRMAWVARSPARTVPTSSTWLTDSIAWAKSAPISNELRTGDWGVWTSYTPTCGTVPACGSSEATTPSSVQQPVIAGHQAGQGLLTPPPQEPAAATSDEDDIRRFESQLNALLSANTGRPLSTQPTVPGNRRSVQPSAAISANFGLNAANSVSRSASNGSEVPEDKENKDEATRQYENEAFDWFLKV